MDLTDKEKQSIRNAIKLLIKDLRKLTDNYPGTIIKVFAFHEEIGRYGSAWYLEITKKEITLKEPKRESDSIIARGNKRNIYIDDADYLAQFHFIKNYDEIRRKVEEIVNKKEQEIQGNIDLINKTKNKYQKKLKDNKKTKKATVEIDVPQTNNQYELVVTEESGKTVGTLKFNGLTLTLCASDGVKIINKPKNKEKVKNKKEVEL